MLKIPLRSPWFTRLLVLALTVLLGAAGLVGSGRIFTRAYTGLVQRNLTVVQVTVASPAAAAGIRPGDRILAVDGIPASNLTTCAQRLRSLDVGETVSILLAPAQATAPAPPSGAESRGAASTAEEVRTVTLRGGAPPGSEILWRFTAAAAGLLALAVGFFIAYQRPEKLTLVFFGICFAIGFFLREQPMITSPLLRRAHDFLYVLFELLLPSLFIHFFLLFPARQQSRRRRLLEWLIYLPPILIGLATVAARTWPAPPGAPVAATLRRESFHLIATTVYFVLAIGLAVALFVRSYRTTADERERAQLRVAVWGTVLGIIPLIAATILANLFPAADLPGLRYSVFALLLIPASFAYAAFRYRVFDLEVLVKRSVLYSVLTAIVLGLYFGVVIGLGGLLHQVTGAQNPVLTVVSVVAIALIAAPARARLQRLTDRVFYRERYDARVTLRRFSHDLARMLELGGIATLLVERVLETLDLESAALLVQHTAGAPFTPLHAAPAPAAPPPALSAHIAHFLATNGPEHPGDAGVAAESQRPHGRARAAHGGADDGARSRPLRLAGPGAGAAVERLLYDDRRAIEAYRAAVAVPLWGRSRLLGVLLLGAPRRGPWLSNEDLDLLETLGEQAAIALDNALLHRTEIERQRVAQELEVARSIQAHLVPDREPECDSIDFAGSTIASHEIGGDFYDYVPIDRRRLGLAIGDASGKGIPAALLMAGLQSSFRMEAERGTPPAQVLEVLNHRIHAVGEHDRFVCFFYGLLDMTSRQITYANAGLDPPILVRASGKVERLVRGGPVLGVVPDAAFDEGKVSLAPGDTLVLYTDGLVEPVDVVLDSGDGEEKLVEFLVANRHEPAARLRELTLARLIALTGNLSLDDTTLIIARAR